MGQECNKTTGQCVCDATSCPNGCCNGNTCEPYTGQNGTSCGTKGANCGPCAQPTPDCSNGVCTCQETTCGSTCTTLNTTSNCSACGDKCNLTNAQAALCNGATCSYTCNAGASDCNYTTAPDTDGCECTTPACCGTSCETRHSDGVGQSYYDCNPLYVTSPSCTFTENAAIEACKAYATAQGNPSGCAKFLPCPTGSIKTDSYCYTDSMGNAADYCFGYTCGTDAGWVESPGCPTTKVGTWN